MRARDRQPPGARRAAVRRRADRGRHDDRRGRRGRPHGRGVRAGRLHQHVDRRGDGDAVHDRGVDARAAGLRAVHPVGDAPAPSSCRSSASAASRTRCRPSGRSPTGHCDLVGVVRGQIADAEFAAKARAGATEEIRLCLSCNQECVGRMGLNRWLGCIENPRTGREIPTRPSDPARSGRFCRTRRAEAGARRRRRARRAAGGDQLRPRRARGHRARARGRAGRPGAAGGERAEPGRARRHGAQPGHRVPPPRRDDRARRRGVGRRRAGAATPTTSSSRRAPSPSRPWWVGGDVTNACDVRDVLTGAAHPAGDVVLIDEIGFHHATSVAELLADRGCRVEVVTPGMVVGQDLGITLDMEQWWIRAGAKGIVQSTDLVPMGFDGTDADPAAPPDGRQPRPRPGLGRARRARPRRTSSCTSTSRRPACPSSGSVTASRRAGPTPPSSRAIASGRRL